MDETRRPASNENETAREDLLRGAPGRRDAGVRDDALASRSPAARIAAFKIEYS
jgi:hypothetical protein